MMARPRRVTGLDKFTADLMRDPEYRDWVRRVTVEGFEVLTRVIRRRAARKS